MWLSNYYANRGFILTTVLVILLMLSIYSLTGLKIARMENALAQHQWQRDKQQLLLQRFLQSAEQAILLHKPPCTQQVVPPVALSLSVEPIKSHDCAVIMVTEKPLHYRLYIAKWWRLRATAVNTLTTAQHVLESVLVMPSKQQSHCTKVRILSIGRQALRIL